MRPSTSASNMPELVRRLWRTPQGALGCAIVALVAVLALAGPHLAPYNPEEFHITARFRGPGPGYWLGTDPLGRDPLSRILVGARPTLALALAATILGTGIGAVVGTVSAFVGGRVDEVIMPTVDAAMA